MTPRVVVMPTFRVLVHGEGLVVRRWWFLRRRLGCYATRFVEAESREAAAAAALCQVRGEPRLALTALQAPRLTVEQVERLDGPPATPPGMVFYPA